MNNRAQDGKSGDRVRIHFPLTELPGEFLLVWTHFPGWPEGNTAEHPAHGGASGGKDPRRR